MGRRSNTKRKAMTKRESRWRKLQSEMAGRCEQVTYMAMMYAMVVEGAGTVTNAERLKLFEGLPLPFRRVFRQLVPSSRGGPRIGAPAEARWEELIESAIEDRTCRQVLQLSQEVAVEESPARPLAIA